MFLQVHDRLNIFVIYLQVGGEDRTSGQVGNGEVKQPWIRRYLVPEAEAAIRIVRVQENQVYLRVSGDKVFKRTHKPVCDLATFLDQYFCVWLVCNRVFAVFIEYLNYVLVYRIEVADANVRLRIALRHLELKLEVLENSRHRRQLVVNPKLKHALSKYLVVARLDDCVVVVFVKALLDFC